MLHGAGWITPHLDGVPYFDKPPLLYWLMSGAFAWLVWLLVHIYYLVGFKNRLFVVMQWAWSYFRFRRGARLIVEKDWRFYG